MCATLGMMSLNSHYFYHSVGFAIKGSKNMQNRWKALIMLKDNKPPDVRFPVQMECMMAIFYNSICANSANLYWIIYGL